MIILISLWLFCIYAHFTKKVDALPDDIWLERLLILGIIEASIELCFYAWLK